MLNNSQISTPIPAIDAKRAKEFYEQKLGFTLKEEFMGNYDYEVNGSKFFIYQTPNAGTNKATTANFSVKNIEEVRTELESKGITLENYGDMPGMKNDNGFYTGDGGFKVMWFKDSEGNTISVVSQ